MPLNVAVPGHGNVGYLVAFEPHKHDKALTGLEDNKICKIICFGEEETTGKIVYVNRAWVRKLEKSSDILVPSVNRE